MKGQTIAITGANRGIGLALCQQLAVDNRIIAIVRREDTAILLQDLSENIAVQVMDLADAGEVDQGIRQLRQHWPTLSVLINNASVQYLSEHPFPQGSEAWERELRINLHAPIQLTAGLLPLLEQQPRAMIVNVTSALAWAAKPSALVYSVSKAGLERFSQGLREQLRHSNIAVTEVVPPVTATALGNDPAKARGMSPTRVAAVIISGLQRRQTSIRIGKTRPAWLLHRLCPPLLNAIVRRM